MSHTVLCIDDDPTFLKNINFVLKKYHQVFCSESFDEAKLILEEKDVDLILLDINLGNENGIDILKSIKTTFPNIEVMMLSGDRNPRQIVECMKLGACEYVTKDTNTGELMACIDKVLSNKNIKDRLEAMIADAKSNHERHSLVGRSRDLKDILSKADRLKGHSVNVLIDGESGTGKEVLARYIHSLESNDKRPFIAINCAAFPDTLIESELFGLEKGSFTGAANRKMGKIELADGGDLFLDEINSLKLEQQGKLLRVLEDKEIYRIGGVKPIKVNFRLIVATNENLTDMVRDRRFRDDLYHRLNVIRLTLSPLRERPDDINDLIKHFLTKYCDKYKIQKQKRFSKEAQDVLQAYDWPGNVRQLENMLQSLVIMTDNEEISIRDLPANIVVNLQSDKVSDTKNGMQLIESDNETYEVSFKVPKVSLPQLKKLFEKEFVQKIIRENRGHKTKTAAQLGISRTAFYNMIRKHEELQ